MKASLKLCPILLKFKRGRINCSSFKPFQQLMEQYKWKRPVFVEQKGLSNMPSIACVQIT